MLAVDKATLIIVIIAVVVTAISEIGSTIGSRVNPHSCLYSATARSRLPITFSGNGARWASVSLQHHAMDELSADDAHGECPGVTDGKCTTEDFSGVLCVSMWLCTR